MILCLMRLCTENDEIKKEKLFREMYEMRLPLYRQAADENSDKMDENPDKRSI